MKNFKNSILFLAFILMVMPAMAVGIKKGSTAPEFSITLSDGKTVNLSDFKGKKVFLHFWATWCPPCQAELPHLNELAVNLKADSNSKIEFIAVCTSDSEPNRDKFMKKNKYTFSGGSDPRGKVAEKYGIQGLPTSILISGDGIVEKIHVGMMNPATLNEFIK